MLSSAQEIAGNLRTESESEDECSLGHCGSSMHYSNLIYKMFLTSTVGYILTNL